MHNAVYKIRVNFSLFVCLNLGVFLYPMVLKTLHVHKGNLFYQNTQNSLDFTKAEKSCQICQFEFVNVILTRALPALLLISPLVFIYLLSEGRVWKTSVIYYSLRAPPVA